MIKSEDQLQKQFWEWAWNTYPQFRFQMWAVPNGAIGKIETKKEAIQASKMKATGLLEGVWDLHCFNNGKFHIIETKFGNNGLTVTHIDKKGKKHYGQKEWGELMAEHGAIRHIYRSLEEGKQVYESIFGNLTPPV